MSNVLHRRRSDVKSDLLDMQIYSAGEFPLSADLLNTLSLTPTFARTTGATCVDYLGNVIMCDANEARFEGGRRISAGVWSNVKPDGTPIVPAPMLLMEGKWQNKITAKTANPVDTTGVTKTGDAASVFSVVDDAAAIADAGLSAICSSGKVYKLNNSAGVIYSVVILSGEVGNLNPHTVSVYCRGGTGKLSLSGANAIELSIVGGASYSRIVNNNKTPGGTNWKISIQANAGQVIYFILPQLEESPVISSVIPNDTGSALTRTADSLSWPLSTELQAMLSIDKAWTTSLANQTGLTWGAEKNQSSFADGQSWFDHPDKDLSSFANSNKMLILRDSAGRLSWGYIGSAGTGQTLGAEKITNGDFSAWSGDNPTGWNLSLTEDASNYVTEDAGKCKVVRSNINIGLSQLNTINGTKKLYKQSITISSISSVLLQFGDMGIDYSVSYNSTGTKNIYRVTQSNPSILIRATTSVGNVVFDDISCKEVLTPSGKGVYIYKDAARTLQGWSMEASFNMNDSTYTFDVVADCVAEGTVVLDWVPGYIPPASQIGLVSCSAAVDSLLSVAASGTVSRSTDGTTPITGATTLTSAIQNRIALRWSSVTRTYQLSSIASGVVTKGTAATFDGAFTQGVNLLLHYSNIYPAKYSNLRFFRRALTDAELLRL